MSSDFPESNPSEFNSAEVNPTELAVPGSVSDHDRWRPLSAQRAIDNFMTPDPDPVVTPDPVMMGVLADPIVSFDPIAIPDAVVPSEIADVSVVEPAPTIGHIPSSTWSTVTPPAPSMPSMPLMPGPVSGVVSPVSSNGKRAWAKPALVGGLIGSLLSGAVSVGAVLATRSKDPVATTSAAPAVAASKNVGSRNQSAAAIFAEESNSLKAAFRLVAPSVVSIQTKGPSQGRFRGVEPSEGAGSGVILSEDGLVLTNAHVIEQATSIKVTLADRSVRDATLVGFDSANDIALVRITNAKELPAATLGQSGNLEVGDQVVAIGNALALEGGPTVTTGIVSALDRDISDESTTLRGLVQTDAAINPGNSGGPLVNIAGEVVGMNTAIIQNSNSIGFAIPIDRIQPMLEELKSTKPRTFIGVSTITLDEETRVAYDIKATEGAVVVDVVNGSPAQNVGLLPGDVIVAFDGKSIKESQTLVDLVRAKKPNDSIKISWKRGSKDMSGTIKLGSALRIGK